MTMSVRKRNKKRQDKGNNNQSKGITMDEKYILELGKILQSIDNLVKIQDSHYSEFKELLKTQNEKSENDLNRLKIELDKEKAARLKEVNDLKSRIEKLEKFDIKVIAYATILTTALTMGIRYLPIADMISHSKTHEVIIQRDEQIKKP